MSNEHNWAGYRMASCVSSVPVVDVCCSFLYRGFEVSMTTYNSRANMVCVFDGATNNYQNMRGEFGSVEDALKWCNRNKPRN